MRELSVLVFMCSLLCKNGVTNTVVSTMETITEYVNTENTTDRLTLTTETIETTETNETTETTVANSNETYISSSISSSTSMTTELSSTEGRSTDLFISKATEDSLENTSTINNLEVTETNTDNNYIGGSHSNLRILNIDSGSEMSTTTISNTSLDSASTNSTSSTFSTLETTTVSLTTSCTAPELSYSQLVVYWNIDNDVSCFANSLNFNCTQLNNTDTAESITFKTDLYDSWDIQIDDHGLQQKRQYNCTAFLTNKEDIPVSKSTSIIIPPGSLEIVILSEDESYFDWIPPFDNQTLTYNVTIRQTPNHFEPKNCEDNGVKIYTYITDSTYFYVTNNLADYNYSVDISTQFWGITSSNDSIFITTPSEAPGMPANVSVKETSDTNDHVNYDLLWTMPCDSNGYIEEYHVKIVKSNETTVVLDKYIPNTSNTTDFKLNLNNLAINSYYDLEINAIGMKNLIGESFNMTFATPDHLPPAPNVTIIDQGSTYFTLSWTIPETTVATNTIYGYSIHIIPVGPNYTRNDNCSQPSDFQSELTANLKTFTFIQAKPFYIYNATVTTLLEPNEIGKAGYALVTTDSSSPEAIDNLTLIIHDNETLFSELKWKIPCDVNGIISVVNVNVSEKYTEDYAVTITEYLHNASVLSMELNLKPSHIYDINITIRLEDGIEGMLSTLHYETAIGFPGIPALNTSYVFQSSFGVAWIAPMEKTGPIQSYELNITSLDPLYNIPQLECSTQTDDKSLLVDVNSTYYYDHSSALPYNGYEVKLRAKTARGYGNYSTVFFNTLLGVPDNVRHVSSTLNMNLSEEYDANVTISFDPPCCTYGNVTNYTLEYHGTRESYQEDKGIMVIDSLESKFKFKLMPDYNYTYVIRTSNEMYENRITNNFHAPSGVPTFNTSITIPINTISTEQAQISLNREFFNLDNGDVKYIALILSTTNLSRNNSFEEWNSTVWPNLTEGTQLTDCFWNPFRISNQVSFTIGNEPNCNQTCGCNGPLDDDTVYYITVRVFNSNFFRDSASIFFRTDKISQLPVILGIIFGILLFVLVAFVGFLIWKNRLYRKWAHIYRRKSSGKPLAPSTTAVPPKKFIQYFKTTQNKPELLKDQFLQLAEKSKDIQAEQSTHFATLLENKRKNRYVNISPYDDTRVKLLIDEDDEIGSDYINASYVKGYTGALEYIATQGPLPTTCRDFWKMVIQENVTIIVMVSQFIEKNKEKCYKYFPKNHENLIVGDDLEIRCSTELHFGTYLVRNLQVRKDTVQVSVTHMQFLEWPDFNVPTGTEHMLQFIYQIRERLKIEGGIVIVHCSAGVGRTGTLIAADMLLQNVNSGKQIDVFNTVLELRKQRVMMVQTVEQYLYLHRLVADHIDRPPTPDLMEASDPVYENMDMLKNHSQSQNSSKRKEEESQF